ncbi:MAG TPA: hypothetical protein VGF43_10555 [Dongiaceae bacterium]|jgi:hypothetical protein
MVKHIKLRRFSPDEVQLAVAHIKSQRPDLWDQLVEQEAKDEALGPLWYQLRDLLMPLRLVDHPVQLNPIAIRLRRQARTEAGMPI